MAKLPKSIIKKYGITKKAWQVFRGKKSNSRTVSARRSSAKVSTVARRRRSKSPSRRKSSRRSSGFGMGGLMNGLGGRMIGGGGYAIVEPLLDTAASYVPQFAGSYTDNIVKIAGSQAIAQGKVPLVNKLPYSRQLGEAGVYIESYKLGKGLAGGMLTGMVAPSTNTTNGW